MSVAVLGNIMMAAMMWWLLNFFLHVYHSVCTQQITFSSYQDYHIKAQHGSTGAYVEQIQSVTRLKCAQVSITHSAATQIIK